MKPSSSEVSFYSSTLILHPFLMAPISLRLKKRQGQELSPRRSARVRLLRLNFLAPPDYALASKDRIALHVSFFVSNPESSYSGLRTRKVATRLSMLNVENILVSVRALGPARLKLLGVITGGHFVIHWFQQLFPVVLPSIKAGLGLNDVQVGALTSARQLVQGTLDFPVGMFADAMVKYRAVFLAAALFSMGLGYVLMGISSAFILALCGAGLIGLGTALWHPPAAASLSTRFPERRAMALAVHGMGATISDTLTPLAVGALLIALYWKDFLTLQFIPGLLAGFVVWRGLKKLFTAEETAS